MRKLQLWARGLSAAGEFIGIMGIWVMTVVTCLDVAGAKLFNMPVPGSTEIISLTQVVTMVFAIAITYLHKGHISVEMFIAKRKPKVKAIIRIIVLTFSTVLFALLVFEGVRLGNEYLDSQEVTATIQLPFYPFAYAFAAALVPVVLLLAVEIIYTFKENHN